MADYAIGDVQGCYDELMKLLDKIRFDDASDTLWFVGDLVNRGPESLAVLRFVKSLPDRTRITLGNHDLYLLSKLLTNISWSNADDTIHDVMQAPDALEIGHWLRAQKMIHYDDALNVVMTHAGISPLWDLNDAIRYGRELEMVLHGEDYQYFLKNMYGNLPAKWDDSLEGFVRLRVICNYLTRMRFCEEDGSLNLNYKGTLSDAPSDLYPWYELPERKPVSADLIFGHWAALMTRAPIEGVYAIDTGCLWGGELTAFRIQDKTFYSVKGWQKSS